MTSPDKEASAPVRNGKPTVRWGRKATGLLREQAGLPPGSLDLRRVRKPGALAQITFVGTKEVPKTRGHRRGRGSRCHSTSSLRGAILPGERIGPAITVERQGTNPADGLEFMYDHSDFPSRLELETDRILGFRFRLPLAAPIGCADGSGGGTPVRARRRARQLHHRGRPPRAAGEAFVGGRSRCPDAARSRRPRQRPAGLLAPAPRPLPHLREPISVRYPLAEARARAAVSRDLSDPRRRRRRRARARAGVLQLLVTIRSPISTCGYPTRSSLPGRRRARDPRVRRRGFDPPAPLAAAIAGAVLLFVVLAYPRGWAWAT